MSDTPSMSKVMVSLPDDLLGRIDEEARRRTTSRSAPLAQAAPCELERRDPETVKVADARSQARFAANGPFESADLVRADRDGRR